jgi:hypothetical protein
MVNDAPYQRPAGIADEYRTIEVIYRPEGPIDLWFRLGFKPSVRGGGIPRTVVGEFEKMLAAEIEARRAEHERMGPVYTTPDLNRRLSVPADWNSAALKALNNEIGTEYQKRLDNLLEFLAKRAGAA